MSKKMTPEELKAAGINIEEEDHSTFSPDVNREFVLKCKNCGCENAREIYSMHDEVAATIDTVMNETRQIYYYCPECKTKVKKYMI